MNEKRLTLTHRILADLETLDTLWDHLAASEAPSASTAVETLRSGSTIPTMRTEAPLWKHCPHAKRSMLHLYARRTACSCLWYTRYAWGCEPVMMFGNTLLPADRLSRSPKLTTHSFVADPAGGLEAGPQGTRS